MSDPFALPSIGGSTRRKKPKAPTPTIGQRAVGALEAVGEGLSRSTLYPITNAMQALHEGKPVTKAIISGFKGQDIGGEGEAKGYGGVLAAGGADPKKLSTRIAAGAANVVLDPINAFFPFGKTAKGVEAAKGLIPAAKNLGEAAELGHRALLTAKLPGMDPITLIKGKPVLKGLSSVGQAVGKLPAVQQVNAAITGKTGNPVYDALKSGEYGRGNRQATLSGVELAEKMGPKFDEIAKASGKDPGQIHKSFLEYVTAPQRSDINALRPVSSALKLQNLEKKLPTLMKGAEREVTLRKSALPSHIEAINPITAQKKLDEMKAGFKPNVTKKRVDFNVGPSAAKITPEKIEKIKLAKDQPIPVEQLAGVKVPKEILDQEQLVGKMGKSYDVQSGAYLKGVKDLTVESGTAQAVKEIQQTSAALKSLRGRKEAMMQAAKRTGSMDYEKLQKIDIEIGENSKRLKEVLASNVGKFAKAVSQKSNLESVIAKRGKQFEDAVNTARTAAKAEMPQELHAMADEAIKFFDQMGSELKDFKPGTQLLEGYFKHIFTQEAKEIMDKLPKDGAQRRAFSTFIGAALHRNFQGKNINEWNEMAMSGKLIPGKNFKLFEDNVPLVMGTALQQHERMKNTFQFFQQTGKLVGKTESDFKAQVQSGLIKANQYRTTNIPELKGIYVPKEVANDLERTYKFVSDPENIDAVSKVFHNINSWYKSYTLPLYPAYHVRNVVGNLMNNAYAGVINPKDYKDALDVLRKQNFSMKVGNETWDAARIMKEAHLHGVIDQGFYALETGLHEGPSSLIKMAEKPKGAAKYIGPQSIPVEAGRKIGTFFENHARVTHFMAKLRDGYTPTAAGASVNKYLFDYGDLGWLSKKARMVMPFMTWTMKNVPLQIENMITKPGFMGAPERFRQGLSAPDHPDERFFSDYMAENFPAYIRTNEKGVHEYFLGGSWIPQADISRVFGTGRNLKEILSGTPKQAFQTLAGLVTPVIKEPISQAFNYDPYFGSEIQKFPGELQKLNYPGGQVQLPARLVHAAKQFRPVSELSNLSNPDISTGKNILRAVTGLKTSPYDLDKSRARKIVEVRRELGKLKGLRNYYMKTDDQKNLKAVNEQIDKLMAGIK
jgi:hypothetical protein